MTIELPKSSSGKKLPVLSDPGLTENQIKKLDAAIQYGTFSLPVNIDVILQAASEPNGVLEVKGNDGHEYTITLVEPKNHGSDTPSLDTAIKGLEIASKLLLRFPD